MCPLLPAPLSELPVTEGSRIVVMSAARYVRW